MMATTRVTDACGFTRLPLRDGSDEKWMNICPELEAYMVRRGWDTMIERAVSEDQPIAEVALSEKAQHDGEQLQSVLVDTLDGKSSGIAKTVTDHNGFESWKRLKNE